MSKQEGVASTTGDNPVDNLDAVAAEELATPVDEAADALTEGVDNAVETAVDVAGEGESVALTRREKRNKDARDQAMAEALEQGVQEDSEAEEVAEDSEAEDSMPDYGIDSGDTEDVSTDVVVEADELKHLEVQEAKSAAYADSQREASDKALAAEEARKAKLATATEFEVEAPTEVAPVSGTVEIINESGKSAQGRKVAEEAVGGTPTEGIAEGKKSRKKLFIILGAVLGVALIAVGGFLIYKGMTSPDAVEKQVHKERMKNEERAENIQGVIDSGDTASCDEVTPSVEGEPDGEWCVIGEFRAFIPK